MRYAPKISLVLRNPMPFLALAASIAVAPGVDKDKGRFAPPAIGTIESKQVAGGVTIAAVPYHTETLASEAFGKLNPYQYGVLPVLLMIQNDSKETLTLERMSVEYIDKNRERIEATPAAEIKYARAPKRPSMTPSPIPGVMIRGGRKNPLAASQIEERAFSAKMLPPGESAYGFVYFQTGHRSGSRVYLTSIEQASTGKELFYFDVPLD
ncbi:MAG: hypothetical protein H7039_12080 [Bryobacteraceae bacterium]|nr:hypothetical protein [Bryobacteraceae bacterium]